MSTVIAWPPVWWRPHYAARRAFGRCYGVPYLRELSRREHHGMLLLECDGMAERDDGPVGGLHWHWASHARRGTEPFPQ